MAAVHPTASGCGVDSVVGGGCLVRSVVTGGGCLVRSVVSGGGCLVRSSRPVR